MVYDFNMNKLKWKWRDLKRMYRWWWPERSANLLIKTVGAFWLWRHGVKREVKVQLFKKGDGWYCPDFAIPEKYIAVEAKGGYRKDWPRDIVKEQRLKDFGWQVLFVSEAEMKANPQAVRRQVRAFLKR
jgi:hypothetical protein